MASLDDYFKKRTEGMQNPAAPAAPNAPATNDPASNYIDRVSKTLSGGESVVQNARQEASTKNAVGDYLANRQAKQESVNAGYSPGTLQSQRIADRYQAGANEAAVARDAGVNDVARQVRGEDRQDIETLINSVKDPVTQAYIRRVQAAGGDVRGAIAGNLSPNYQQPGNQQPGTGTTPAAGAGPVDPSTGLPISKTPAQLAQEAAQDWVKTLRPDLDPSTPEFTELVNSRVGGADEAQMRVISEANKAAKIKDAQTAASANFANLTPDQEQLLSSNTTDFNPREIPVGRGFDAFKQTNPIVKVGGKLYKPVNTMAWRQGKDRDFSVLQAKDGSYLYVDKSGKTTTQPPPDGTTKVTTNGTSYQTKENTAARNARSAWLESFK